MHSSAQTPSLGQIAITVSSIELALRFYRDWLGLEFLFAASTELAFLQAGAVRVMLTTAQGAGAVAANSVLYFKVIDLEATYTAVVNRGAVAERSPALAAQMPDHQLWLAFIRDPDGNLVGLMEEKR